MRQSPKEATHGMSDLYVLLGYVAQGFANRWDRGWDRQLADGDSLVASGRFAQAEAYFQRLDRVFPAPSPQQARDKQREHLLRQLALAYEGAGHKHLAMVTYDRLIDRGRRYRGATLVERSLQRNPSAGLVQGSEATPTSKL